MKILAYIGGEHEEIIEVDSIDNAEAAAWKAIKEWAFQHFDFSPVEEEEEED